MAASRPLYLSEEEINSLRDMVGKHFPVYSTNIEGNNLVFFSEIDESTLEAEFNELRMEVKEKGYIPIIKRDKGEYLLYLTPFKERKGWGSTVNLVMLALTIITASFAGVLHWASYMGEEDVIFTPENIFNGILYFALPLLLILGTHEMGHYVMAKKRNVRASMPFFMPFMPPLGTMGAFISLREPIPDRKSLIDIGIAGPIAGFIVAIPVTIIGMILGNMNPPPSGGMEAGTSYMQIQVPLMYSFLSMFVPTENFIHPTAFAGWVGFIVTAINLFPAGQLDGGHIARAALGDKAKYASYASIALLFAVGIFLDYWGWLIFASLILFLGARHAPPLNDISPLDASRKALGVVAAVLLVISFVPVPMSVYTPEAGVSLEPMEGMESNMSALPGSELYFNFTVENTGELTENITLLAVSNSCEWNMTLFEYGGASGHALPFRISLKSGENESYTLEIDIPENASPYLYDISIIGSVAGISDIINLKILVPGDVPVSMLVLPQDAQSTSGGNITYTVQITSLSEEEKNLTFSVFAASGWNISIGASNLSSIPLKLMPYEKQNLTFRVYVPENTSNGTYAVVASLSSAEGPVSSVYLEVTVVNQERSRA